MNDNDVLEITNRIHIIRGRRVMFDSDLAILYGIETSALNRQVKRNQIRFPVDFMFQLSKEEFESLICQIGISKIGRGGRRTEPFCFTENGVAMLSSVLKSEKAALINIAIMRIFTKLRSFLMLEKELSARVNSLESVTSKVFKVVFERLNNIEKKQASLPKNRKQIGFK